MNSSIIGLRIDYTTHIDARYSDGNLGAYSSAFETVFPAQQ